MEKRINASRIILDRRRLLGFDLASDTDGTSVMPLSPKIGPKEARGFNACSTAPVAAAKVGQKDPVLRSAVGCHLDAKVGRKEFVRFDANLPISVRAKIGFKTGSKGD